MQRELQQGVFVILCLRCAPDAMTAAEQQAILKSLHAPAVAAKVAAIFKERQRRPLPVEFPIVGGADLADRSKLMEQVFDRLRDIVGTSDPFQVSPQTAASAKSGGCNRLLTLVHA